MSTVGNGDAAADPRPAFTATSVVASITVGSEASPNFLTDLISAGLLKGFEFIDARDSIKNVSGRDLQMSGGLFLHTNLLAGSSGLLSIYSETSTDNGVSWNNNPNSKRDSEIAAAGEGSVSLPSFLFNWPDGAEVRFRTYTAASMNIERPPAGNPAGNPVEGYTILWSMKEVR